MNYPYLLASILLFHIKLYLIQPFAITHILYNIQYSLLSNKIYKTTSHQQSACR